MGVVMQRSILNTGCAVALALALGCGASLAEAAEQVVVASWGGSFQDTQRATLFKPFEEATGIKVVEATQPYGAKIKAMVESGNTEWDVAEVVASDYILLEKQGLLEKIDYSKFDAETREELGENAMGPFGVLVFSYSRVIAWSTKTFPPGKPHPENFADVWDTGKFPGERVLDAGDYTSPPNEYALIADGVPIDKLYPLDLARSYKSLERIRPHVIKWAESAAVGPQALVDGEADVVVAPQGRLEALKKQGAAIDYTFNQGLLKRDFWVVPKGSKSRESAMKFIAFVSQAKQQAALCSAQPYGPANKLAFKYIDAKVAATLPTDPDNLEKQFVVDDNWWAETDPQTGKSWREQNVILWNKWTVQ
jgi:putative spermidine/putrescine transport system substrate-binding protein